MGLMYREYYAMLRRVKNGEQISGQCRKVGCEKKGTERQDNGLLCGCWCQECFDAMIRECRSRSW